MDIDINQLRGFTTLTTMIAFLAVVVWAWSKRRQRSFDEAANLPFSEEEERIHQRSLEETDK